MFIPKKTGRPETGRPVRETKSNLVTTTVLFLVAGISVKATCSSARGGSDGGSFKASTGLVADDAAGCGTE